MTDISTAQAADLRQLLTQRQSELERLIKERLHADGREEVNVTTPPDGDRSDAEADASIEQLERDIERLNEVNHALSKFGDDAAGAYGQCEDCQEAIGFARLLAHPAARFCLSCQSARERGARRSPGHKG